MSNPQRRRRSSRLSGTTVMIQRATIPRSNSAPEAGEQWPRTHNRWPEEAHALINNLDTLIDLLGDGHTTLSELLPDQRRRHPRQPHVELAREPGGLVVHWQLLAPALHGLGPGDMIEGQRHQRMAVPGLGHHQATDRLNLRERG